jgi:23S rRNA (guanosine2251-2'-O)-methyltransferase
VAEIIYGIRPVVEALKGRRRRVIEVLDSTGSVRFLGGRRRGRQERSPATGSTSWRGEGSTRASWRGWRPIRIPSLEEILAVPEPLVLVLDGVTDPRNLGAVLRAADGAGASGVVIPKDKAVGVTAAAVKASAGASEHVRVARVTNLRRAVDALKAANVWVYAAEAGGTDYAKMDLAGPVAFVLGSEGRGVRRLVREACDGTVSVPMLGAVSSLNVSVAAAVWRTRPAGRGGRGVLVPDPGRLQRHRRPRPLQGRGRLRRRPRPPHNRRPQGRGLDGPHHHRRLRRPPRPRPRAGRSPGPAAPSASSTAPPASPPTTR